MVRFKDPVTGFSFNPTRLSSYKRVAGMIVALGVVFFGVGVAQNQVTPFIANIVSGLTGGAIGGTEQSGGGLVTFGNGGQ